MRVYGVLMNFINHMFSIARLRISIVLVIILWLTLRYQSFIGVKGTTTPFKATSPHMKWHIQFTDRLSIPHEAAWIFLDLFDTDIRTVRQLVREGKKPICYFNAGAWEDWRPDADQYPDAILGSQMEGWPGERWIDIRDLDVLKPIIRKRLDLCKEKGFIGVDPDNVNGYQNDTSFPLTAEYQLQFNRWLASEAHKRGLLIGLKNDAEQANILVQDFDWMLVESCIQQGWCDLTRPFYYAQKPIFAIEYVELGATLNTVCPIARAYHINAQIKHINLDSWSLSCP